MYLVIVPAIISSLVGMMIKSITIEKFNSKAYTLLFAILGSIVFAFLALVQGNFVFSNNLIAWFCLCLTGVLFSLANTETYTAYKTTDFSLCSILYMSNIIISVILSVMIFKDEISVYKSIGILVIFIGSILVFLNNTNRFVFSKGALHIFNAAALAGSAVIANKIALQYFPLSVVGIANFLFQVPFVISKNTVKEITDITKEFFPQILIWFLVAPFSWSIYMYALKNGNVSVVQPVYQSTLLVSQIVLGIIVLKESKNMPRKICGLVLNVIGIILVNL